METLALAVLQTELSLNEQILVSNPFNQSCLKFRNESEFNIMLSILENIMLIKSTKLSFSETAGLSAEQIVLFSFESMALDVDRRM